MDKSGAKSRTASRVASLSAIAVVAIFVLSVSASVLSTPGYAPVLQYLSELGIGPGAAWFNYGMMATGIALALFFVSSVRFQKGRINTLGNILGVVAAASLVCVGVFPGNAQPVAHVIASLLFFSFAALGILTLAVGSCRNGSARKAGIALSAACVLFSLVFLFSSPPLSQIFENLTVAAFLAWLLEREVRQYRFSFVITL